MLDGLRTRSDRSVLVIGGGVNGIGTFFDLALQGVDVLLAEKNDFCSGASAASSHMAHGGIRYLENGEFRLVREAVRERNCLLANAAHYVRPLPTTIPIFKIFSGLLNAPLKFFRLRSRPAERGAVVIKFGLMLYDAYTGDSRNVPRHRFTGRRASLKQFSALNPEILATATYYDAALLNPERLCIEMIRDAEAANPDAQALNYCSVIGVRDGHVILEDRVEGERFAVKPAVVVNAAGPWIDRANRVLGRDTAFIGGTKGSHLVLDHAELREAIGEREFFFENEDGRIVLIYPFFDRVLVGTSDLPIDNPDAAVCTEDEVDYFLSMIRRVFPGIVVDRDAIVFRFSGVRPLPNQTAATTGQISRDHSIETLPADGDRRFPVFSLIGGKWTTFRAFAEQAADLALAALERDRRVSTDNLPIGGGLGHPENRHARDAWASAMAAGAGIPTARAAELLERYGTYAELVGSYLASGRDRPLAGIAGYSVREIEFLALREKVVHLEDLLLRRTLLGMLGRLDRDLVRELAGVAANALGWDGARLQAELRRVEDVLLARHQVRVQ